MLIASSFKNQEALLLILQVCTGCTGNRFSPTDLRRKGCEELSEIIITYRKGKVESGQCVEGKKGTQRATCIKDANKEWEWMTGVCSEWRVSLWRWWLSFLHPLPYYSSVTAPSPSYHSSSFPPVGRWTRCRLLQGLPTHPLLSKYQRWAGRAGVTHSSRCWYIEMQGRYEGADGVDI